MTNFLKGSKATSKRVDALSPGQGDILDLINQGVRGEGPFAQLFGGFDPAEINRLFQTGIGDPARQQFQQRTVPGMEQGAAASGLSRSSGLQRKIGEQEFDLEGQLSALLAREQAGAREGAMNRQQQGIQSILQTPESFIQTTPGSQSIFEQLLPGAATAAGSALFGPALGAAGNSIRQLFKR